jgi:hypothetical protein
MWHRYTIGTSPRNPTNARERTLALRRSWASANSATGWPSRKFTSPSQYAQLIAASAPSSVSDCASGATARSTARSPSGSATPYSAMTTAKARSGSQSSCSPCMSSVQAQYGSGSAWNR